MEVLNNQNMVTYSMDISWLLPKLRHSLLSDLMYKVATAAVIKAILRLNEMHFPSPRLMGLPPLLSVPAAARVSALCSMTSG